MSKKYDPVIDFTAFSKLRDELQNGLASGLASGLDNGRSNGFNSTKDRASSRRLEEVGEEIGDALTRGFSELFGRIGQTASTDSGGYSNDGRATNSAQQPSDSVTATSHVDVDHSKTASRVNTKPWQPLMDCHDSEDTYTLVFEVAGVDPSAIEMELAGNTLTLSGSVTSVDESQVTGSTFSGYERRTGAFERSVELPADALTDDLTATAGHGLLTVSVPKQQSLKPRKITIAVADQL